MALVSKTNFWLPYILAYKPENFVQILAPKTHTRPIRETTFVEIVYCAQVGWTFFIFFYEAWGFTGRGYWSLSSSRLYRGIRLLFFFFCLALRRWLFVLTYYNWCLNTVLFIFKAYFIQGILHSRHLCIRTHSLYTRHLCAARK